MGRVSPCHQRKGLVRRRDDGMRVLGREGGQDGAEGARAWRKAAARLARARPGQRTRHRRVVSAESASLGRDDGRDGEGYCPCPWTRGCAVGSMNVVAGRGRGRRGFGIDRRRSPRSPADPSMWTGTGANMVEAAQRGSSGPERSGCGGRGCRGESRAHCETPWRRVSRLEQTLARGSRLGV